MKKILLSILIFTFPLSVAHAQFAGGSGAEEDPYQVETVEELQNIQNHTGMHYIQIANIDAGESENWNNGRGFEPIGHNMIPFTGSYDGNGYEISGLTINRQEDNRVGLFGVAAGAQLKNIVIRDSEISGGRFVGALIGYNNRGQIINSHSTGTVSGIEAGGLLGFNTADGYIENSYSEANVLFGTTGGLVGINYGTVKDSYATGVINGEEATGGLVGVNNDGTIINSYATGEVISTSNAGGLVGENSGHVENSYASGDVTGESEVGGLVGLHINDGLIATSFSVGLVTGANDIGGLIGLNEAEVENSYWDTETSNQNEGIGRGTSDGATGLTTNEMTGDAAIENMHGFDFGGIWQTTEEYPELLDYVTTSIVQDNDPERSYRYKLAQNYPNPFNPATQIIYTIPEASRVLLEVYNIMGQRVVTLVNETKSPGKHEVSFDAGNFSSGVYIYRLKAGDFIETKRMLYVK